MRMLLYQQQISISPYNSQNLFTMICPYCQPRQPFLANSYNIELVHQRFIPTYCHTQIFAPADIEKHQRVRCTPTFHSQIMNTNGYGQEKKKATNSSYQNRPKSARQVAYKNQSIGRTQEQFYNRKGNCCYRSKDLWYDNGKEDLFKKLECCGRDSYAHDRKQIDLGSNPVFGGGVVDLSYCQPVVQESPAPPAGNSFMPKDESQKNQQSLQQPIVEQKVSADANNKTANVDKPKEHANQQSCKQQTKRPKKQRIVGEKKILKKGNVFNRTIVQGWPTFTIVRKRDW